MSPEIGNAVEGSTCTVNKHVRLRTKKYTRAGRTYRYFSAVGPEKKERLEKSFVDSIIFDPHPFSLCSGPHWGAFWKETFGFS